MFHRRYQGPVDTTPICRLHDREQLGSDRDNEQVRRSRIRRSGIHQEVLEQRKGKGTPGQLRQTDKLARPTSIFYTDHYPR